MPNGKKAKYLYARLDSPYWYFRFTINGQEYRGTTKESESKAASLVVEELRVQIRADNKKNSLKLGFVRAGKKQISLRQCFALFETDKEREWSDVTGRQRQSEFLLSLGEGPEMLVSDITQAHLTTYRRLRTSMPNRRKDCDGNVLTVCDATVNREMAHLKAALNHVADYDFCLPNLNWKKAMIHEAEEQRTRCLSEAEERRLFSELETRRPDMIPLVKFSILAGQRQAATLGLRWDMVDLDGGFATVALKGKGRKKRLHTFALTSEMIELIQGQDMGGEFVFTYECTKGRADASGQPLRVAGQRYPFTKEGIKKPWAKALNAAGIRDFRWHDLRHTCATRLIRATGNILLVQQLLGHGDIGTTARYANLNLEDLRHGMEAASHSPANLRVVA